MELRSTWDALVLHGMAARERADTRSPAAPTGLLYGGVAAAPQRSSVEETVHTEVRLPSAMDAERPRDAAAHGDHLPAAHEAVYDARG